LLFYYRIIAVTVHNSSFGTKSKYFLLINTAVSFKNTRTQERLDVSNIEANTEHVSHFVTTEIMCSQVKLLCHGDRATW
jgi:hypothetical protein